MIQEYKQKCGYNIGSLKPYIYIILKNGALINYKVDNGLVDAKSITANHIYKLYGNNVLLTNKETYNERFNFSSEVSITINEMINEPWFYALGVLRNNMFYVVVENMQGEQFIQSVEFPSEFTYNYTFNNGSVAANYNTLTFKCQSNIPTMLLDNNINETQTLIPEKCGYNIGNVKNLKLCNFKSTYIKKLDNFKFENIFTNGDDRYELVEFNKDSFSFTESYQNDKFTDTLTFTIPLSKYKFVFHYNLIEFKKNRYTITFQTLNNVTIASGFEFGYFPSYTIQTSEDVNTPNTITITLKHVGEEPLLYTSDENPYIVDTSSVRTPLSTIQTPDNEFISTDVCINETQAVHTLVQEYTVTGQPLNKYWCLEGYELKYNFLNIVGTYTYYDDFGSTMIFNSAKCAVQQDCQIIKSLPVQIIFTKINESVTYTIQSTCDWSLSGIPSWLNVNITSGLANEETTVVLRATQNPTAEGKSSIITMTSGNDTRQTNVILQDLSAWISPLSISCTAQSQTVNSFLLNDTISSDVSVVDSGGTTVSFQQKNINILVGENKSEENQKTYRIILKNNKLNDTKTIVVIQDKIYVEYKWLSESAYICSGRNSYKELTKFIGYTPNNINIQTDVVIAGELIKENDARCVATMTRWKDTNQTICQGATKYVLQEEEVSYDYGATWEKSGNTRPGSVIEKDSPDCSNQYTWVYENTNICINGNLYKQYIKYYNDGINMIPTGDTKIGEVIEIQSPECMSAEDNTIQYTFTYDTLITNTVLNNLKVSSDTNFSVNWGDGTTNNYLASDYTTLKSVNHIWEKAGSNNSKKYTVLITGGIRELRLDYPDQYQSSGWFYTNVDVDKGINLQKLYVEHTKFTTLDLTHNRSLLDLEIIDNYHQSGLTSLTLPQSTRIQYIHIGNQSGSVIGYITEPQLQKILDDLPQYDGVKRGLVDFCWNRNKDNIDLTCGLDYSELETKNWFKSLPCCANVGSIKYQRVATDETRCEDNYELWSLDKLQYAEWEIMEGGTGRWSSWKDVTPYAYFLNTLIEKNSTECGYVPTEVYEWRLTDTIICNGTTSYFQEQQYVSEDKGLTWTPVEPSKYQQSSQIRQEDDPDCGFVPPADAIYRFVDVPGEWLCDEEDTNCLIENAWIPIGFQWNGSGNGGTFTNKTITTVPTICDSFKLYTGENLYKGLQLVKQFPSYDTTNMESMKSMFEDCISVTTYPVYTSKNVKNMSRMFYNCNKLASVEFDNTAQVTDMSYMFSKCKNLISVKGIDLIRCFNINNMFDSTSTQYNSLITVQIKNCNVDLNMKTCFKVNHESLVYIIENSIGSFNWYIPKSRADLLTEAEATKAASKGINIIVN